MRTLKDTSHLVRARAPSLGFKFIVNIRHSLRRRRISSLKACNTNRIFKGDLLALLFHEILQRTLEVEKIKLKVKPNIVYASDIRYYLKDKVTAYFGKGP